MNANYIAGFFDGEGCAYLKSYKASKTGKIYQRPVAKLTQVDRGVLDEIVEYFGCGNVYEKFDKRAQENGWQIAHEAVWSDLSARKVLVEIEPFLIVKKKKVSELLDITGRKVTRKNSDVV